MIVEPDSFAHNLDILEQLNETIDQDNIAYLKFEWTPRGVFVGVLKASDLAPKEPHCKTCQCSRVDAPMPSHPSHPEIKRTKSWHHGY